jgi:RNA polymerase sigma-70 factor (ECF subfamily)
VVDEVERRMLELFRNNARNQLATLAIETYGAELYGFLANVLDGSPCAADVLSQTIEAFWYSLSEFRAGCSVRTWLYLLARRTVKRHKRQPWHRLRTGEDHLTELVAFAHSRTAPWQQTAIKTRFRDLRDKLDPDDRMLLVLRIDRDMEWTDIAQVTLDANVADRDATELAREAARLRKRFQLIKGKLREHARESGLLKGP